MLDINSTTGSMEHSSRAATLPGRVVVTLRAGAVLAIANVLCVVIFSWAWMHVRAEPRTITVTGSARQTLSSDLIVWDAHVSAEAPTLAEAATTLSQSRQRVLAFLKGQSIPDSEIVVGAIESHKNVDRKTEDNNTVETITYQVTQPIEISSSDIDRITDASRKVTDLVQDGVQLESDAPRYIYTKLADLKVSMLAQATADATARARQIAENSGSSLGAIMSAKMGVMQINALHSDDVSSGGVNDTTSREKEITAIVNATFSQK